MYVHIISHIDRRKMSPHEQLFAHAHRKHHVIDNTGIIDKNGSVNLKNFIRESRVIINKYIHIYIYILKQDILHLCQYLYLLLRVRFTNNSTAANMEYNARFHNLL